jgi:hypothetical protein
MIGRLGVALAALTMLVGCVGSAGANVGLHYVPGVGARVQAEPDFNLGLAVGNDVAEPDVMITYGIAPGVYYDLERHELGGGVRLQLMPSFLVDDYMLSAAPQLGFYSGNVYPQLGLAGQVERAFPFGETCPGYHLIGLRPSFDKQLDVFGNTTREDDGVGPWDLGLMATYRSMKQFLRSSGSC